MQHDHPAASPVSDTALGMHRAIDRHDIVDGKMVGMAVTDRMTPWPTKGPAPEEPYPPARAGMRGSGYPRAFANGHAMREGWLADVIGKAEPADGPYDLVVVGGGISGLSAAYFFQKQHGWNKKVLVLDNHDDFGGHAKRNEFTVAGRTCVSNGGSFNIYAPRTPAEQELFADLGIDVEALATRHVDTGFYASMGMGQSVHFDKATFGVDRLLKDPAPWTDFTFLYEPNVPHDADVRWADFMARAPMSEVARKDIYRLYHDRTDYMPGLTVEQKLARLERISYIDYLRDYVRCDPMVWTYLRDRSFGSGRGLDATTALAAQSRFGFPGFQGLGLPEKPHGGKGREYHFPDGNATIARLLVGRLVPGALPARDPAQSMAARVDYTMLDRAQNATNIRLNATVINVRNEAKGVAVTYMVDDTAHLVKADACVMACWFHVIPYLCPDMPVAQREALHYNVHTPNLWVNVWLSNWRAFHKAGTCLLNAPNGYYASIALEFPVSVGDYRHSQSPDQPISLTMVRGYGQPGLHIKDQFRAGRIEMYETSFETYEHEARQQLQAALGPFGFDAERDIQGITVNRWGHGYSYWYSPLYDDFLLKNEPPPHIRARQRFGRITIANTDAGGTDTTALAISQAYRAVQELAGVEAEA